MMGHMGSGGPLDERGLDRRLFKRLLSYAKPYRASLLLAALLLLLITLGEQSKPYFLKRAIDDHLMKGDWAGASYWVLAYLTFSVTLVFGLQIWQTIQTKGMGESLMMDLRRDLFAKVHSQPMRYFDKNAVGSLMTRVIHDVENLNQLFTAGLSAVFQDFFTLLVATSLLMWMDWRMGLLALAFLPLMALATAIFRKRARANFREERTQQASLNGFLAENLSGMATVQLFHREERNLGKFDGLNDRMLFLGLNQIRINAVFMPLAEILSSLAIACALFYGGMRHLAHGLELGVLVATVMYIQRFYEPLRDLADKFNILQRAMASSERIFSLLDAKDEIQDPVDPIPLPRLTGHLRFENVSFAYADERWVLKDLSFEVKAGERVAVVGPTGAGKTSLVSALYRFYPIQKGQIYLDGLPIDRLLRRDFRQQLALVPQDPFLFSGSLRDNLRLSDPSVAPERVEWACRQAGLHEWVLTLPKGYESEVREGGNNFSTGQKQLLSLARALVFDPALLVLDEATASVDTETEEKLHQALEVLMRGRSSLTIAHRLSTVMSADKILVINDGRLVEQGNHEALMRQGGLYRSLVELQFKDVA